MVVPPRIELGSNDYQSLALAVVLQNHGTQRGSRTPDPLRVKQPLVPLSYLGVKYIIDDSKGKVKN